MVLQRGFSVSYLKINDVHEYNLPYVQSDFTYNLGPTLKLWIYYKWSLSTPVTNLKNTLQW